MGIACAAPARLYIEVEQEIDIRELAGDQLLVLGANLFRLLECLFDLFRELLRLSALFCGPTCRSLGACRARQACLTLLGVLLKLRQKAAGAFEELEKARPVAGDKSLVLRLQKLDMPLLQAQLALQNLDNVLAVVHKGVPVIIGFFCFLLQSQRHPWWLYRAWRCLPARSLPLPGLRKRR